MEAIAGAIGRRAKFLFTEMFAADCTARRAVHRGAPPKARVPLVPPTCISFAMGNAKLKFSVLVVFDTIFLFYPVAISNYGSLFRYVIINTHVKYATTKS